MPKVQPYRSAFNAGEFSILVEGRTDLDRYPASLRQLRNFIATPQGPALRRPGLQFAGYAISQVTEKPSKLLPFIVNDAEAVDLEFADGKMRVHTKTGVLAHPSVLVFAITSLLPFEIEVAPGHGLVDGNWVIVNGLLPPDGNNDGVPVEVLNVTGDTIRLDNMPAGNVIGGTLGVSLYKIYEIVAPYVGTQPMHLRGLQDVGDMYLFHDIHPPYILARFGTYDYRLQQIEFISGPYMPVDKDNGSLTFSGTGNPIPDMTSANTPSGVVLASDVTPVAGHEAWMAFDGSLETYWESETHQAAWIAYDFPAPRVINGYVIYIAKTADDATYAGRDYAPGTWEFRAFDGVNWVVLDAQYAYTVYDNGRSIHFKLNNTKAYIRYELNISEATRNGPNPIRIARITMTDADQTGSGPNLVNVTLNPSYPAFNGGTGFLPTDVGRLIRFKPSDNLWRQARITAYASATVVTVLLLDEPMLSAVNPISDWQPGFFGQTLGFPSCGAFQDDRLWMGGTQAVPDLIVASRVGAYGAKTDMTQRTPDDTVLEDGAIVIRVKSRRLSRIHWLKEDERGLLWGSSSAEGVVSAPGDEPITAFNVRGRASTHRGSASYVDPVKVDKAVLFIQTAGRTLREFAYNYEADGFRSPSMSLFASHLGVPRFTDIAYMAEPYSLLLLLREDGRLVTVSYNRDENVVGWQLHTVGPAFVHALESMSVTPDAATRQDSVLFTVNRGDHRYLERWSQFWDFGQTLGNDVCYLDRSLTYDSVPANLFYGLRHFQDGAVVDALADNRVFKGLVVNNGQVVLPEGIEATKVRIGWPYESYLEIARIDAGGASGTSMGKAKHVNVVHVHVWDSYGGEIGKVNQDYGLGVPEFSLLSYEGDIDGSLVEEQIKLRSGILKDANVMAEGWDKDATIHLRHSDPTPFNVIAMSIELNVGA